MSEINLLPEPEVLPGDLDPPLLQDPIVRWPPEPEPPPEQEDPPL